MQRAAATDHAHRERERAIHRMTGMQHPTRREYNQTMHNPWHESPTAHEPPTAYSMAAPALMFATGRKPKLMKKMEAQVQATAQHKQSETERSRITHTQNPTPTTLDQPTTHPNQPKAKTTPTTPQTQNNSPNPTPTQSRECRNRNADGAKRMLKEWAHKKSRGTTPSRAQTHNRSNKPHQQHSPAQSHLAYPTEKSQTERSNRVPIQVNSKHTTRVAPWTGEMLQKWKGNTSIPHNTNKTQAHTKTVHQLPPPPN